MQLERKQKSIHLDRSYPEVIARQPAVEGQSPHQIKPVLMNITIRSAYVTTGTIIVSIKIQ